jgi:hypothetical protein
LLTTAGVLYQAYEAERISIDEADKIWTEMLSKRRKLPASSFSEYLSVIKKGKTFFQQFINFLSQVFSF